MTIANMTPQRIGEFEALVAEFTDHFFASHTVKSFRVLLETASLRKSTTAYIANMILTLLVDGTGVLPGAKMRNSMKIQSDMMISIDVLLPSEYSETKCKTASFCGRLRDKSHRTSKL